jgi:regulator of protease activity HflC (stomatin/prohibitin superfamily)
VQFLRRSRTWFVAGASLLGVFLLYEAWHWGVERVEVPPGHFLVVINLWGKELPDGDVLAPDATYKGIQREVLPEGRYFLNPLFYRHEIHPVVTVPQGKCAVLTRKYGKPISPDRLARGDVLAREGERGVLRDVLREGSYRLNPHAYGWQIIDAVRIDANQVGVRTLKIGKDSAELPTARWFEPRIGPYMVPPEYRGVQYTPVSPGTYYLNPHVESIVAVRVSSHTVTFHDIEFPSLDGFTLRPDVQVKYRVLPEKAPELLVTLTDEGHLNQGDANQDEQSRNQVLQKVVLPVIRGTVRLKGSTFQARDFVGQERILPTVALPEIGVSLAGSIGHESPYQQLREELMRVVPAHCKRVGVEIEDISLGKVDDTPELVELAKQVQEREQARLKREQNRQVIEELRTRQINAAADLGERERLLGQARVRRNDAAIEAKQKLEAEEKKLIQDLENAQTRRDAAEKEASAIRSRADAEAQVIEKNNKAQVEGLKTALLGFPSPEAYAQYQLTAKLAPALAEVFASDTGEFARLFTQYLSQPNRTAPMGGADGR